MNNPFELTFGLKPSNNINKFPERYRFKLNK